MDPISLALIAAIGAGVTSSVTDATKASLVAVYKKLKTRVLDKVQSTHPKVAHALAELEEAPTSQGRQAVLVEEISTTQLPHDPDLLPLAQALLEELKHAPGGSQNLEHVSNSAISYSGNATTNNVAGDQHLTQD